MELRNKLGKIGSALALGGATVAANAGGGFTVPASLTDAVTSVTAVGAAVFSIAVAIKLYKWFKRAL